MTPYRIGIAGHRHLGQGTDFVRSVLRDLLVRLKAVRRDKVVALSALAVGADTLFAETALAFGIPLEVVVPFAAYAADFPLGAARQHFEALLARACAVHHLPYEQHSTVAYLSAGYWIVDQSDLLVAVWDEQPARGEGGTGQVAQYARDSNHPLVVINPVAQTVWTRGTFFCESPEGLEPTRG
ncbi:MAG TPA: hypothetical protein VER55_16390 [Ardenticatenaceae bacterium]|nr:hypothetical protein [Ardenticatenaceae bacterium]